MSKAEELLKEWVTRAGRGSEHNPLDEVFEGTLNYINRKDKLVVGSKWVCDVEECLGGFSPHYKDEVCNVIKVFDDAVYIQHSINYEEDEIPTEQFLVCFSPVEKENV